MKLAMTVARQPLTLTTRFVYVITLVLIVAALGLGLAAINMATARTTPVVPTRSIIPASAPLEYRIPSEPVDYNDPNYIGSYGG